jgi:hypothetical protein
MNRLVPSRVFVCIAWCGLCLTFGSLRGRLDAQQPETPGPRVEARKEIVINWTLGDQSWNFKEVLAAYEPIRGFIEPRGRQGTLAVWKMRLTKAFEEGTVALHEQMPGSPFKVVSLDADRTIINPDLPAQITPPSGKMDDTIELLIALPDNSELSKVKSIRIQRRTEVGF